MVGSGQTELKETLESLTQASVAQTQNISIVAPSKTKFIWTRIQ